MKNNSITRKTSFLASYINYTVIVLCFANVPIFAYSSEARLLDQSYIDGAHYNQICWLTSHNSFAYKDDSFSSPFLHPNQKKSIKK